MKRPIITSILIILCIGVKGQELDSLRKYVLEAPLDTNLVHAYNDLSIKYWNTDLDSSTYFGFQGLKLGDKINFEKGMVRSYNALGVAYTNKGLFDSARVLLKSGLELAQSIAFANSEFKILNALGVIERKEGNFPLATDYFLKAVNIAERIGERKNAAVVLSNVGNIYLGIRDFEQAIKYYQESLVIFEEFKFKNAISVISNNMADCYGELGDLDKALSLYKRSLIYKEESRNYLGIAITNTNIGQVFSNQGVLDSALYYFKKSIDGFSRLPDTPEISHAYLGLANAYHRQGALRDSEIWGEKALATAVGAGMVDVQSQANRTLSLVNEQYGKLGKALKYHKTHVALRDSLISERNIQKIERLSAQHESEKSQQEIERLKLQAELNDANLARSRNAQVAIAVGSVMLIVVIAVYFVQRNKKLKAEAESQELQIEALEKRFMELNISPKVEDASIEKLNEKIHTPLTEREFEVLSLSFKGKTNSEIAEEVFLSISTVKFHLRNVYGKLGVNNRKEALDYVVKSS